MIFGVGENSDLNGLSQNGIDSSGLRSDRSIHAVLGLWGATDCVMIWSIS